MPITFDRSKIYNFAPSQSVEQSLKSFSSWAGIHVTRFNDFYQADELIISGDPDQWNLEMIETSAPYDLELYYSVTALGHGVVLRAEESGAYFFYGIDGDSNLSCGYWSSDTGWIQLIHQAVACPAAGNVIVSFREHHFSDDTSDIWVSASIWINDALIHTGIIYWASQMSGVINFGFATWGSGTLTNLRVPQLTEFTEWSSLDPGEFPMGGMQRFLEGRYVKHFIRFDGSFYAWRGEPIEISFTFDEDLALNLNEDYDFHGYYNHIRMIGAYEQAEFIHSELVRKYGHRFIEVNNPYLMSPEACYIEAQREIRRLQENFNTVTFVHPFMPLLEPEDRIGIIEKTWLLTRHSIKFTPGSIQVEVLGRLYTYE